MCLGVLVLGGVGFVVPQVCDIMHVGVSVSLLFFKWFRLSKSILHDGQLEVKKASFNLLHGYPPQLSQGLSAYHLSR